MSKTRIATLTYIVLACISLTGCGRDTKSRGSTPDVARRVDIATPSPPVIAQESPQSVDGRSATKQQIPVSVDKHGSGGDGEPRTPPRTQQQIEEVAFDTNAVRIAADASPDDLSNWLALAASRDYSAAASNGDARAQLLYGLSLIHNDLAVVQDRVPLLSSIPVIGKRMFEKTHYFIDENASPGQVATAYQWVKRSCDQHFAPAFEVENLFRGRADSASPADPAMESDGHRK